MLAILDYRGLKIHAQFTGPSVGAFCRHLMCVNLFDFTAPNTKSYYETRQMSLHVKQMFTIFHFHERLTNICHVSRLSNNIKVLYVCRLYSCRVLCMVKIYSSESIVHFILHTQLCIKFKSEFKMYANRY